MKLLTALVAIGLATIWAGDAYAASRKHRERGYDRDYRNERTYRSRSNTRADNGLCQRDTGTPNSGLSFRNKCDVEEFWLRQERNRR